MNTDDLPYNSYLRSLEPTNTSGDTVPVWDEYRIQRTSVSLPLSERISDETEDLLNPTKHMSCFKWGSQSIPCPQSSTRFTQQSSTYFAQLSA
jgi:hypothetical protein